MVTQSLNYHKSSYNDIFPTQSTTLPPPHIKSLTRVIIFLKSDGYSDTCMQACTTHFFAITCNPWNHDSLKNIIHETAYFFQSVGMYLVILHMKTFLFRCDFLGFPQQIKSLWNIFREFKMNLPFLTSLCHTCDSS